MHAHRDIFRLELSGKGRGKTAFKSRIGAISYTESREVVCFDLKHAIEGRSKCIGVFPTTATVCSDPVLAVSQSYVAISSLNFVTVFDLSANAETVNLKYSKSNFRGKTPSCADWANFLAQGTVEGSIQLWDLRCPGEVSNFYLDPLVQLEATHLKFGKEDFLIASTHGDAVVIWDIRQPKSAMRRFARTSCTSFISGLDWLSPSDLVVASGECIYRLNHNDSSTDLVSDCVIDSAVCAIPGIGGKPLVAFQKSYGRISLLDPYISSDRVPAEPLLSLSVCEIPQSIAFLEDSKSLVLVGNDCLFFRDFSDFAESAWPGGTLLPSIESSPKLTQSSHPSLIQVQLEDLARRVRRLYMEATVTQESNLVVGLEVAVPFTAPNVKLKILISVSQEIEQELQLWWINTEEDPSVVVPSLTELKHQFFSNISVLTDPRLFVQSLCELKQLIAREYSDGTIACAAGPPIPFPATCGVCWSPKGDLYRFQSLKGLGPWPKHRQRLSMDNFFRLKEYLDANVFASSQATTIEAESSTTVHDESAGSNTQAWVKVNTFCEFNEPILASEEDQDELELDAEFNQRVFPDQCVEFMPSTVFEVSVEDHWFASLAPKVRFSASPLTAIESVIDFCRTCPVAGKLVLETFQLVAEIFRDEKNLGVASGLKLVLISVLEDRLKALYAHEETQAVAILSVILTDVLKYFNDSQFIASVNLLVHDHAGLFQRLGCFVSSRVLEKHQHYSIPLLCENDSLTMMLLTKTGATKCSECDFPVRGLGHFCLSCGYGGHPNHVSLSRCKCSSKTHS